MSLRSDLVVANLRNVRKFYRYLALMQSEVAQERRDGRARADHGQPPRGAPQPREARARLRGPRRGLDLREGRRRHLEPPSQDRHKIARVVHNGRAKEPRHGIDAELVHVHAAVAAERELGDGDDEKKKGRAAELASQPLAYGFVSIAGLEEGKASLRHGGAPGA